MRDAIVPSVHTIATVLDELEANDRALDELVLGLDAAALSRRPAPARWSPAEHVEHLNLSTEAYLPLVETAAADLRARGVTARGPLRTDLMGRFLIWMVEPPVRKRVRTSDRFVPGPAVDPARVVARFHELQRALLARVRSFEGLALDRARVTSPFDARVRYSAWSALRILAPHQRRHLWLARRDLARRA
ncbi:MAG: DinB family protein [Planctomycetes bacterium]|nr:DinB family protein [Planctomycetota bacterium]